MTETAGSTETAQPTPEGPVPGQPVAAPQVLENQVATKLEEQVPTDPERRAGTDRPGPAAASPEPGGWLRRLAPLTVLPVAGLVVWYILAFNPTDRVADPTGPCLWHMVFSIDGPSCGGTRMVWHLLHGNLVEAARHHLAAFLALPFVAYAYFTWVARWTFDVRAPLFRPSPRLLAGYLVFFLLYATVLRNLPWEPFTWFYVANLT